MGNNTGENRSIPIPCVRKFTQVPFDGAVLESPGGSRG